MEGKEAKGDRGRDWNDSAVSPGSSGVTKGKGWMIL